MNNQEVFDKVVTHLRTQGVPSMSGGQYCQYRGPNGTSCAAGCLIPDNAYTPELEGNGVHSREVSDRLEFLGFTREQRVLLNSLQQAHDNWAAAGGAPWGEAQEATFAAVAKKYQLTMTEAT